MYGYNLDFHYNRKNIFYFNIFELIFKKIEYMYYVQIVWFKLKQTNSKSTTCKCLIIYVDL